MTPRLIPLAEGARSARTEAGLSPAAALNDAFRRTLTGGQVMLTRGVAELASLDRLAVLDAVRAFDAFIAGCDPYGEHDFGAVEHDGTRYFFKIDAYDRDYAYASPDPADPAVTARVMTIMRADEYGDGQRSSHPPAHLGSSGRVRSRPDLGRRQSLSLAVAFVALLSPAVVLVALGSPFVGPAPAACLPSTAPLALRPARRGRGGSAPGSGSAKSRPTGTASAVASASKTVTVTFSVPRSTRPTYERSMPAASASPSWLKARSTRSWRRFHDRSACARSGAADTCPPAPAGEPDGGPSGVSDGAGLGAGSVGAVGFGSVMRARGDAIGGLTIDGPMRPYSVARLTTAPELSEPFPHTRPATPPSPSCQPNAPTPVPLIRSLGLALLLSLGSGPALADRVVGDWTVAPYDGTLPTRCIASNRSDENGAVLTAIVGTYGDIQFVLTRPTLDTAVGEQLPAEFLIDGRVIALRETKALDRQTVQFVGNEGGRNEGALLHGLERGGTAVVQMAGLRSTFTLDATAQAMALLSHCVGDPSIVASASVAERDLEAADDFPDEVKGDAAGPQDGSGDPMAALLDGQAAYAQLRCSIAAINLFGLFSANAAPIEFDLSINADATASVNGTTIASVAHRMDPDGSGPSVSIYRAREILSAQAGSPLAELFANAPRPPQGTGDMDLLSAFTNPGGLIPKNRLLKVSLLNDEVTVADQLADGQFGNVSAHRCYRLR